MMRVQLASKMTENDRQLMNNLDYMTDTKNDIRNKLSEIATESENQRTTFNLYVMKHNRKNLMDYVYEKQ